MAIYFEVDYVYNGSSRVPVGFTGSKDWEGDYVQLVLSVCCILFNKSFGLVISDTE